MHRVHVCQRAYVRQSWVGRGLACQKLESYRGDLLGGVRFAPGAPLLQQERQGAGDGLVAEIAVGWHEGRVDHGIVGASGEHSSDRRLAVEPKGRCVSQARIEPVHPGTVALVAAGALLVVERFACLLLFCRIGVGYYRRDERAE